MALINPGTTPFADADDLLNPAIIIASALGVTVDDTPTEATARLATALEALDSIPRKTLLRALLPADASDREAFVQDAFAGVAGTTAAATAAQIRAGTSGLYIVTPQELDSAKAPVALTVVSNVIPVDGEAWWNGAASISAAAEIGEASNLHNEILRLRVTASGERVITPHSSYVLRNIDATVTVPDGKTAFFLIEKVGETVELTFGGTTA